MYVQRDGRLPPCTPLPSRDSEGRMCRDWVVSLWAHVLLWFRL